MYSSRHHYHALASDHAMMLDEYMNKPSFLRPNLHQNDVVDSPVRACDCLVRSRRLTMPRPAHLFSPTADSAVIDFSFTMVIINSAVDDFWFNISSEIHPVYFYITYYFYLKEQLLWLASSPMQDKLYHWAVDWLNPVYITVKYEESQDSSSSCLKTRGLQWHDSAKLAGVSEFKNSGSLEGR